MTHQTTSLTPLISIVIPMYNEEAGVDSLFSRLMTVLNGITTDWEVICVNDGSTDGTLATLKRWHQKESRIKCISLSRNFGKEAALTAGLQHTAGKAVIPLDADLQDPPELIPEMLQKWREGYKVVLAVRKTRQSDTAIKKYSAALFYKLINRLSDTPIPENAGDFRLMDQQVVHVVRLFPERSRYMKGLFTLAGFKTTQIYFDREMRSIGSASQSYFKLLHLAKDGIISFTTLPLQMVTSLGVLISVFAFAYAAFLLLRTIVQGVDVPGYASIMATILCMGGIQLICVGIIGEYIGRVYNETKRRPLYVIEESTGLPPPASPDQ